MSADNSFVKTKSSVGGMVYQMVGNFLIWQIILYIPYIALGGLVYWLVTETTETKSVGLFCVLGAIGLAIVNRLYEFITWKRAHGVLSGDIR